MVYGNSEIISRIAELEARVKALEASLKPNVPVFYPAIEAKPWQVKQQQADPVQSKPADRFKPQR